MPDLDQIAADLQTAGHPYRLKILARLVERDHSPDELADSLLLDPRELETHLARLRKEGWIQGDEGQGYRISDPSRVARVQRFAPEIFPKPVPLPEE